MTNNEIALASIIAKMRRWAMKNQNPFWANAAISTMSAELADFCALENPMEIEDPTEVENPMKIQARKSFQ